MSFSPKYIICHHSGGTDTNPLQDSSNYTLTMCNEDHRIRFNMRSTLGYYVGYHYFIDKYGVVTQARIDTEEGAHCVGYNNHPGDSPERTSIGICMAGNFDLNLPTDAQIVSLKRLINQKCVQYTIPKENVIPHRKFSSKTCYGNKLSDSWGSSLVNSVDNKTKIREHLKAIEALL